MVPRHLAQREPDPVSRQERNTGTAPVPGQPPPAAGIGAVRAAATGAGNQAVLRMLQRAPADPAGATKAKPKPMPDARPLKEQVSEGTRSIRYSYWNETASQQPGGKPSATEVYWAEFTVDARGVLDVSARMATASGVRAPGWSLGGKFKEALDHFKSRQIEVKGFEAAWGYMDAHERSANLDAYWGYRRAHPKASPEEAARNTPSGKVATALGYTEVKELPWEFTDANWSGEGAKQPRPEFRFRFQQPGAQIADKAPEPAAGKAPTVPPTASGGASGDTQPKYSKTDKAAAGLALFFMGANIALNGWIAHRNEQRIKEDLKALEPQLQKQLDERPNRGILLAFGFKGAVDSGEGPTAEGRFTGIGWIQALSERDGIAQWNVADKSVRYQFAFIPPRDPIADGPSWTAVGMGGFADPDSLEFRRLGFAQVGGLKTYRNVTVNSSKWHRYASSLRFFVLRPPDALPYRGARGGDEREPVTVRDVTVAGGTVPAMVVDDDPIVCVVAADDDTRNFFMKSTTIAISDMNGALQVGNIDRVRFLDPDQVQLIQRL
jgi:hypothetical protein